MTKTRGIKKYNISKHHFCELSSFCLQYGEWKEELLHRTHSMRGTAAFDMPKGQCKISDPTADLAIRRVELEKKCQLLEETAFETDKQLHSYILRGVRTVILTSN